MKNLHIVICSDLEKSNGGCEIWLDYFIREIIKRDFYSEKYVYHVQSSEHREAELQTQHVELTYCSHYNNGIIQVLCFSIVTLINLFRNVKRNDDVVYIGSTFVAPVGILFSAYQKVFLRKTQMITWIRSIAVQELKVRSPKISHIAKILEILMLYLSDKIILNGKDTFAYYQKQYNVIDKSEVIENAVPNRDIYGVKEIDHNKAVVDIAYMGRYSAAKGFDCYIKSIEMFYAKQHHDVRFHAYGHGPLANIVPDNFVVNHGKYYPKDVIDILNDVDVVVFFNKSGIAAGVSHSLLETMASGRGIIAWDNHIHNQVCTADMSFLVEEDSLDDLVKLYQFMAAHRSILYSKASNARTKSYQYSVDKHVDAFIRFVRG